MSYEAEEMDALLFGSLVHDTPKYWRLERAIDRSLRDRRVPRSGSGEAHLRAVGESRRRHPSATGQAPPQEFAYWQARHAREGWRIGPTSPSAS